MLTIHCRGSSSASSIVQCERRTLLNSGILDATSKRSKLSLDSYRNHWTKELDSYPAFPSSVPITISYFPELVVLNFTVHR